MTILKNHLTNCHACVLWTFNLICWITSEKKLKTHWSNTVSIEITVFLQLHLFVWDHFITIQWILRKITYRSVSAIIFILHGLKALYCQIFHCQTEHQENQQLYIVLAQLSIIASRSENTGNLIILFHTIFQLDVHCECIAHPIVICLALWKKEQQIVMSQVKQSARCQLYARYRWAVALDQF